MNTRTKGGGRVNESVTIKTKTMIDDLKTICANFGLGGSPGEYKIITHVFLYKYLCDKFLFDVQRADPSLVGSWNLEDRLAKMSPDDYDLLCMALGPNTALLRPEHFISRLYARHSEADFHKIFDDTLVGIARENEAIFSVQAGDEARILLFEPISQYVIEAAKKPLFCRALINKLVDFSFAEVFEQEYDFFAQIFEYLIKDYNKDFGKYAEYYTPHVIASIIARIMVPDGARNVTVYDPAAGTGTLVLALAHQIGEDRCTIYTQDISSKSNEFLRLNLILNDLVHSLPHVVHDDTLIAPRHYNKAKTALAKFDYIVSNPPFNMDFSDNRETLAGDLHRERFFAGVPNVPKQDKKSMAIYQMFIQHIIYSLAPNGKAAVVVPTGFLTAGSGIPQKLREHMIRHRMLRGVVSMPSNIFATTGTNVSILFIDRANTDGRVTLIDASKLGTKEKVDGKNQKTVLSSDEIVRIIDTFNAAEAVDDFSAVVSYEDIEAKKFSFSAGQYFDVKIEYVELTPQEFADKMHGFKSRLSELFAEGRRLEDEMQRQLERVKYEN